MPTGNLGCVLLGESPLVAGCASILLERGHRVLGLVAEDPDLRRWAEQRDLPWHAPDADMVPWLRSLGPVDHLFSITNPRILPGPVLAVPERSGINFHDALLPRHGGLDATSWAVLETATAPALEHGVTWHVLTEEVDGGDLLLQRPVRLDRRATAHDLDLACFQAGLESFAELVDGLATGRAVPVPQDRTGGSYHAIDETPPDLGLLRWSAGAAALDALVRAADLGSRDNGFGTAKLLLPDGRVVLVGASRVGATSTRPPGTVVAVGDGSVTVATADLDLVLSRLRWPDGGGPVGRLDAGVRLPEPDDRELAEATRLARAARRHERFWVRRLADRRPLDLPYRGEGRSGAEGWDEAEVPVPPGLVGPDDDAAETVAAAVLAFLGRIGGGAGFDVGLREPGAPAGALAAALFAAEVPVRVPELTAGLALGDLRDGLSTAVGSARRRGTHLRDLRERYPRLAGVPAGLPIALQLGGERPRPRPGGSLLLHVPPGGRTCRLVVARDVLDAEAVRALAGDIATFLAAAAGAPEDLTRVELLAGDLRRRVLHEWNDTATDYPRDRCLPDLVARQAERRPDAVAVVDDGGSLSYRELAGSVQRLAGRLRAAGIGPGDRVAVQLRRSRHLVSGLLGVLASGAAYVPLDPIYPPDRIRYMLDDAAVAAVLTEPGSPAGTGPLVLTWPSTVEGTAEPVDLARPENPAYVIYTSGSSGRPKGVQVGHRALTNLLCAMAAEPGCTEGDRLLAVTTVCFDIAALELFLPLVTGGTVDVAGEAVAADGFALRERMERTRPTVMQATPATWRMLVAAGWAGDPGLRILCGGEALPPDLARELCDRGGAVWNLYGPTETTIWSAAAPVAPDRPVTIGRPIANTRFAVLDRWDRPVPPRVPGELHIGGDGVADGYVGRPELTRAAFRSDPLGGEGLLYRTGDLVAYRPDGELEYLGRLDQQIKLHGYRIELGEVEAVLERHPGVERAVAAVRTDAGPAALVAYLVPAGPQLPPAAALRAHAGRWLPGYMVPSAYVPLAAVPLTRNGKVDRRALPAPPRPGGSSAPGAGPAPRTSVEATVAAAWRSVLGLEQVGVDDNFFDLGGNSLLIIDLVAQLRPALDGRLTPVDLFGHPTVRTLARHVEGGRAGPAAAEPPRSRQPDRAAIHERRRRRAGT